MGRYTHEGEVLTSAYLSNSERVDVLVDRRCFFLVHGNTNNGKVLHWKRLRIAYLRSVLFSDVNCSSHVFRNQHFQEQHLRACMWKLWEYSREGFYWKCNTHILVLLLLILNDLTYCVFFFCGIDSCKQISTKGNTEGMQFIESWWAGNDWVLHYFLDDPKKGQLQDNNIKMISSAMSKNPENIPDTAWELSSFDLSCRSFAKMKQSHGSKSRCSSSSLITFVIQRKSIGYLSKGQQCRT